MSLILEALRKSEAERRRGQAPDLFTELPPAGRRRAPALSPVLWALLAAAVLVAAAWLMRESWPLSARDDDAVIRTDGAGPLETTDSSASTQPVTIDAVPGPARNVVGSVAVIDAPVAAIPPPPAMPAAPPSAAPVRIPAPSEPPRVVAAVPVAPAPPATTPAAPLPPTNSATPLKLADLSVEQRKQLPPLRMSMHMWDQDPTRRFVIIDGARHGEGDRIGATVVEEINADSVLLNWNGVRLRVSMR